MEIVLLVEAKDFGKVKDVLLKDSIVSLASVVIKDGKSIGKKDYYIYISGLESQCKKALELAGSMAKSLEGKEKEEIITIVKEEENRAVSGFGGVFGNF